MKKNKPSVVREIDKVGLCVGCGICTSLYGEGSHMFLGEDGFLHPNVTRYDSNIENQIENICPGVNLVCKEEKESFSELYGPSLSITKAHSLDKEIRQKSSSGGVITAIASYLLESSYVDTILQVGVDDDDYERNILKRSRTSADVLSNASSRYAPSLIFDDIIEILNGSNEVFGFVGKPCDVATIKRFIKGYPEFQDRIRVTIALLCAGIPSLNATKKLIAMSNPSYPINNLRYRGDGWPGNFSFVDNKGVRHSRSYNDSWGQVLGKDICFRCKICPDGIGIMADFAVGDAWDTIDGYPDFTERKGESLVICRTDQAKMLYTKMLNTHIASADLNKEDIGKMQPYQLHRRKYYSIRALAFTVLTRMPLNTFRLSSYRHVPFKKCLTILKEFLGTFLRLKKKFRGV
ncbi:Coenzyme F420 hydrogenase/dehydrogenase, beta subunit C-terminal domain [Marinoscillum sp. MHG1-6]|uniref:Coenzyme F420 hydrogenase/dehydrogenase, beta subunit C-terminal domain n=1 Tax=Marinoscillum sp. MHG1-6 TaxID=2959627 RepID=UPI0021581307|nr:Coenzyme F420 hydrogenase/dehydrogenase, beta subunit C-terminal domain [Marinoscillum sp. MHG1-6]